MKRVITAALLLALVVAACFGSYRYVSGVSDAVAGALHTVQDEVQGGDFPAARAAMEDGYALWRRHYRRLGALMRHNEIDDAERLFQRARQALDNETPGEALLHLRELRGLISYLPEMERPTYSNLL